MKEIPESSLFALISFSLFFLFFFLSRSAARRRDRLFAVPRGHESRITCQIDNRDPGAPQHALSQNEPHHFRPGETHDY